MRNLTRTLPWVLSLLVLTTVGCATQNSQVAVLERENNQLRAQRDQLNVRLTATTEQLTQTRQTIKGIEQQLAKQIKRQTLAEAKQDMTSKVLAGTRKNVNTNLQNQNEELAKLVTRMTVLHAQVESLRDKLAQTEKELKEARGGTRR